MSDEISITNNNVTYKGSVMIETSSVERAINIASKLDRAVTDKTLPGLRQDNRRMQVTVGSTVLFDAEDLGAADRETWVKKCGCIIPRILVFTGTQSGTSGMKFLIKQQESVLKKSLNTASRDIAATLKARIDLATNYFIDKDFDKAIEQCETIIKCRYLNSDFYYEALFLKSQIYRAQALEAEDHQKFEDALAILNRIINDDEGRANLGYKMRASHEAGLIHLLKFQRGIVPGLNKDGMTNDDGKKQYIETIRNYFEWSMELCSTARKPKHLEALDPEKTKTHRDISYFSGIEYRTDYGEIFEAAKTMLYLGALFSTAAEDTRGTSPEASILREQYSKASKDWYRQLDTFGQFRRPFIYKDLQKPSNFYGYRAQAFMAMASADMKDPTKDNIDSALKNIDKAFNLILEYRQEEVCFFYLRNYFERALFFDLRKDLNIYLKAIIAKIDDNSLKADELRNLEGLNKILARFNVAVKPDTGIRGALTDTIKAIDSEIEMETSLTPPGITSKAGTMKLYYDTYTFNPGGK
ncbi:MAG: hypothetical protein NTZ10_06015 [Candidatus Saganbacteria bacterium]|nr:hypothetical protein [Candidatus Saganbacteria bacterium]